MGLSSVSRGKIRAPLRVLLYGVEGVGKSTFGAGAPSPIFLGAEDGTGHLDVARFPKPEKFTDALEAVRVLERDPHDYKTLVIDSLDWLEPIIWEHVNRVAGMEDIEAHGYGKGFTKALDRWRELLAALERLRTRGMNVVTLAHAVIKTFKNPAGEDYDRYTMKLNDKAGGLLKEWSDIVLFANFDAVVLKKEARKGKDAGRVVYTTRKPAYDAKNRHDLPEQVGLSWAELVAHADPQGLKEMIQAKAAKLPAEVVAKVNETLGSAQGATDLLAIYNRVSARVKEGV